MVHVEEAELLVLLPQNHEDRVEELQVLVVVVQPYEEAQTEIAPDALGVVPPNVELVSVAHPQNLLDETVAAPRVVNDLSPGTREKEEETV